MHVALVGDVEDKFILGRVKNAVESDGQLDDPEVRADVATVFRRDSDQALADFLREQGQLGRRQRLDVLRAADLR